MRIVSSNSDAEMAEQRKRESKEAACDKIGYPLRHLAANLMRVSRGAGRPEFIGRQCVEVVDAFNAYRDVVGCYPSSDEISEAIGLETAIGPIEGREPGIVGIVRGSLQMVASGLLEQTPQIRAGERELNEGVDRMQAALERLRREAMPPTGRRKPGGKNKPN